MNPRKTDISNDLLLKPCKSGIKLVHSIRKSETPLVQSIGTLLNLPISFYLLDSEGNTKKINSEGAIVCGYDSIKQAIGKSILEVGVKESAKQLIDNCHEVIATDTVKIFEENHVRKDGNQHQFLSVKCPWYDQDNKIIGVCGFSIVLGKHALAQSLSFITQMGLLNQPRSAHERTFNFNNSLVSQLTKREMECLTYTVRGFTAKRIARELNISFRTVEEYLTNIRIKFGAVSKAQLIEMVLEPRVNTYNMTDLFSI